jgi:cytoskeletal protein RodZ
MAAWLAWVVDAPEEFNDLGEYVEAAAADAESAKTDAEAAEAAAESAKDIAVVSANATVYDSGTTYDAGDVVFDPSDNYKAYTSQQDANQGNTPVNDDGTWWEETIPIPITSQFSIFSTSSITYTLGNLTEIEYTSGNKIVYDYNTDNTLNTEKYYAPDGITLLATLTHSYIAGKLTGSVWT